jgi:hypothetical protein
VSGLRYVHADVFSASHYSGTSVPVFCDAGAVRVGGEVEFVGHGNLQVLP